MVEKTKFGLIGKNISYSFSRKYFTEKFEKENLNNLTYRNFDLPEIEEFPFIVYHKEEEFGGFNVTTPYKESIQKYLTDTDPVAQEIGAVNTIKITKDNELIGYNTDTYGFESAIKPLLKAHHEKALILGTGGASKAIAYVLKNLNIEFIFVSRKPTEENQISYDSVSKEIIETHQLIINCTPVGTYPNIEESPDLAFQYLTKTHILFDLIYNPDQTKFLSEGKKQEATIINGYKMLEFQAEKSWEIWNS